MLQDLLFNENEFQFNLDEIKSLRIFSSDFQALQI